MLKKLIIALAITVAPFIPTVSQAQQPIGSYVALLSEVDHFSSAGQRLTSAAAIIRQDRANYHRYGIRDPEDGDDTFFRDADNRAALEQMLDRGRADPGVIGRIVNGTPMIRVDVYQSASGPFIQIGLLDKSELKTGISGQHYCLVADPTGTPLNVRTVPNGKIVATLKNGSAVRIIDSRSSGAKSWAYVGAAGNFTFGWVFRDFLNCGQSASSEYSAGLNPRRNENTVPAPSSAATATERTTSPALEIEAIELASNFILQAKLNNPRVFGPSETPAGLASHGAAWAADEGIGTVEIITDEGRKGLDVAAALAAADSKDCGGKFASGRVSELVDSDVVFRGFASCEDSTGTRVTQHLIVPRAAGGFVIFSLSATGQASQPPSVTEGENLVTLRKAALVSVETKRR